MVRSNYKSTNRVILWLVSTSRCPKMFSSLLKRSQCQPHVEKGVIPDFGKILKQLPYVLLVYALTTDRSSWLSLSHPLFPLPRTFYLLFTWGIPTCGSGLCLWKPSVARLGLFCWVSWMTGTSHTVVFLYVLSSVTVANVAIWNERDFRSFFKRIDESHETLLLKSLKPRVVFEPNYNLEIFQTEHTVRYSVNEIAAPGPLWVSCMWMPVFTFGVLYIGVWAHLESQPVCDLCWFGQLGIP